MGSSYLNNCLSKRLIFFTGKGGVGKSALSWATAIACRRQNRPVILISWNPFDSETKQIPSEKLKIRWEVLDAVQCFHEYALNALKFEKVYDLVFKNQVFNTFVTAAPGLAESMIAGKIWDTYAKNPDALILVDLPASGHALTFFSSPMGLNKLFRIGVVHRETERVCEMYRHADTEINLVALPEELPVTETVELKKKLDSLNGLHFGYVLYNQCVPEFAGQPPQKQMPNGKNWERYQRTLSQETESIGIGNSLSLPLVKIPRLPTEVFLTTIEAIAAHLEGK